MQKISVDLSISQVYRSRKTARGLITGNEEAQYGLLRDYAKMIRRTDVGSKVILQIEMENEDAEPKFKRIYIRYNAQKVSFLGGYRPFVGLDGCHLKGKFVGQLLSATAKDGNDNIFPVAMAVVEQKNKDNWIWFLEQFIDDIGRLEELNLVFISDKQKGLLPAIETLFPTIEHGYCVKHIYNNFKVNHKGMELKSVLWRDKPNLSMLEWIKVRLMTRLYTKKIGIEKYRDKLCPSIQDKLEKLKLESKGFCAMLSGRFVYEGSGRPSARRQGSQAPASSQPLPTPQPYTMASSSSNQAARSQPPTPQAPQPQAPAPWSKNPSQWYSSDFRYIVKRAPWFSSSQPAPYTPAETWESKPLATRGDALRGRGDAART
ncbi:hypothetical protein SO802_022718 [Lithocarpus litseifolius]|uniref:MULE transposase domain-containing protein n=1 Tax=Lithocarpus litseifolius TaxID=425828 RepID=A0AAW2C9S1_9ROSI